LCFVCHLDCFRFAFDLVYMLTMSFSSPSPFPPPLLKRDKRGQCLSRPLPPSLLPFSREIKGERRTGKLSLAICFFLLLPVYTHLPFLFPSLLLSSSPCVVIRPFMPTIRVATHKDQRQLVALHILCGLNQHRFVMMTLRAVHGRALEGRIVGHGGEDVVEIDAVVGGREGGKEGGRCERRQAETQNGVEEHEYDRELARKRETRQHRQADIERTCTQCTYVRVLMTWLRKTYGSGASSSWSHRWDRQ
jgi:hypothetical protein